jgi:hypothetical protein
LLNNLSNKRNCKNFARRFGKFLEPSKGGQFAPARVGQFDRILQAIDNTWIERFCKSLKYDYIYLNPCDNCFELFEGVQNHIAYYHQKKHQTTGQSPNKRYNESIKNQAA